MRLADVKTRNKCDHCNHVFDGHLAKPVKIINVEPFKDIRVLVLAITGELFWAKAKQGDMILSCPKCETLHPVGFDEATSEK